jgi:hypothetical protein
MRFVHLVITATYHFIDRALHAILPRLAEAKDWDQAPD